MSTSLDLVPAYSPSLISQCFLLQLLFLPSPYRKSHGPFMWQWRENELLNGKVWEIFLSRGLSQRYVPWSRSSLQLPSLFRKLSVEIKQDTWNAFRSTFPMCTARSLLPGVIEVWGRCRDGCGYQHSALGKLLWTASLPFPLQTGLKAHPPKFPQSDVHLSPRAGSVMIICWLVFPSEESSQGWVLLLSSSWLQFYSLPWLYRWYSQRYFTLFWLVSLILFSIKLNMCFCVMYLWLFWYRWQ